MWELDYKESWVQKNGCFWTVVLEKILESPLDCKEIQPVHPKGNQSWIFIGRTDAEAETPILWAPDVKSWLIWKDPDAGKDWGQEKGTTEDEMAGWHHWDNGHVFGWTLGVGDGQGGPVYRGSWCCKESRWLSDERKDWLYCFCTQSPPSAFKSSCRLGWVGGESAFGKAFPLSPSPPVSSIQNKTSFAFHPPVLFIGFWAVSSWTPLLVTWWDLKMRCC